MDEAQRARSLVRQPPSAATLAWLVEELGASAVVEVSVLQGGLTSAMHRVTVVDRGGSIAHRVDFEPFEDEVFTDDRR